MKTSNKNGVAAALRTAAMAHCLLTVGVILCVAASVAASLLPPLLLARMHRPSDGGPAADDLGRAGLLCQPGAGGCFILVRRRVCWSFLVRR